MDQVTSSEGRLCRRPLSLMKLLPGDIGPLNPRIGRYKRRDMRRKPSICFAPAAVFIFVMLSGCVAPQKTAAPGGSEVACIQGVVSHINPGASSAVPYSYVIVTAWRHGKDQGLAEVKADKDGRYCIEVPADANTVDLRAWGTERFEGKSYVCEGEAKNIDVGAAAGKCGSGQCLTVDITAQCKERVERRRGY